MILSTDTCYTTHSMIRVGQGDIFYLATFPVSYVENDEIVSRIENPDYLIVLTQDCDLEQDFNDRLDTSPKHDKYIDNILVLPLFQSNDLRYGNHLKGRGYTREHIGSDAWRKVKQNLDERYHFLPQDNANQLPELVTDFKLFFTIYRDHLYNFKSKYKVTLDVPYRENLAHRFVHYLSRVALPTIKTPALSS